MIKNYLLTAIRNLKKTKLFSLINLLGLAIGMTACLLIMYYVQYENSYDKFNESAERIYRLRYERSDQAGESAKFASCCPPAGLRIRENYPEVEKVARIFKYMASVSFNNTSFIEERLFFAEPEFTEIYKLRYINMDGNSNIRESNRALISKSSAKKYFGDDDPLGKVISLDKKADFKVIGVFEDMPSNSHIKIDILLSYSNLLNIFGADVENSWGDTGWYTYILLKPGADPQAFEKKLTSLVDKEFGEVLKKYNLTLELKMQPLKDIHLTSHFMQEFEVNGDKNIIGFLSIIALFIIIIAWVNYINLSTARSLTRAKEVGLRKVVGASKKQLIFQFFVETFIINLFALLLTFILILISLPIFRELTGIPQEYGFWSQTWYWQAVIIMFFAGVFLSGLYPILVLSSFKPVKALRGKPENQLKGFNFRKVLVLFQFIMALLLITGTVAVFRQLSFMKNQDLGFSLNQKVVVRAPRVRDALFSSKLQTFKDQLLNNTYINKFCVVTEVPGKQILWDAGGIHRAGSDENKNYQIVGIDYEYTEIFNLKFRCGRNYSKSFPSDSNALILNETASQWLGFENPEAALGKQVIYWEKTFNVIGVLKDYHQQSLKAAFEPHIFRLMPYGRGVRGFFIFDTKIQNMKQTIDVIRNNYSRAFPDNPFEYFFLDEYYNKQYKGDEIFGKVFGVFSLLAILVTSLGVLGLSSFMISKRTKEIGIRKILGAGIFGIVHLLLKDFLLLILISFIVVVPLSYYGITFWLQSYAAKMDISGWLFLIPLFIVLFATLISVHIHVLKAIAKNPIESLRYE